MARTKRAAEGKDDAQGRRQASKPVIKSVLCRTCLGSVEAREGDRERPWYFVDRGTETIHKCKEGA